MDEREKEELLYRVDERTERMEDELMRRLNDVEKEVAETRGRLNAVEEKTTSNTKDVKNIKAVIGAIAAGITTVAAKTFEILHI